MYCERQINQESGIFSPSSLRKPQQYFEDKRAIQACFADWVSKLGQNRTLFSEREAMERENA